ncbi:hypothetical protein D5086_003732, partial [Populus alba]
PTPAGAFTFEWDTDGKELVIKRRGVIYWTSGPLKFNTSLEIRSLVQNYVILSNADEDYLMFTVSANQFTAQGQRNFTMWQLTYDGSIADQITGQTYGGTACKGNNTDVGCERWSGPPCRSNRNSFELRSGFFVNTVPRVYNDNSSLSISDCKDICWKHCLCVGVSTRGNNANNTGCKFYYGSFTPDPSGRSVQYHIIVEEELFQRHDTAGKRKSNWIWIILAPLGFVSLMGLAGLLWYLRRRRLREKYLNELLTLDSTNDTLELENDGNKGHNLKRCKQEYAKTNFTLENLNWNKKRRKNYIPMAAESEASGLNGKLETSLIPLLKSPDWTECFLLCNDNTFFFSFLLTLNFSLVRLSEVPSPCVKLNIYGVLAMAAVVCTGVQINRFYLFYFCASHALAAGSLYQGGDSLNSSTTLVSKNGLFTLGFTRLGSDASYLGIWHTNDTSHPFWLANRDKSIADNSGVLGVK